MSVAQELEPAKDIIFPPGDIESHEPPLESDLHLRQIILLLQCLELWWQNRNDFYAAGNLTIYYSQRQHNSQLMPTDKSGGLNPAKFKIYLSINEFRGLYHQGIIGQLKSEEFRGPDFFVVLGCVG